MNEFEKFVAASAIPGMLIVEQSGLKNARELEELGLDSVTSRSVARLASVFFGKSSFSQKQREARELASNLTIAELTSVENIARGLKQTHQWELRLRAFSSGKRNGALSAYARTLAATMRPARVKRAGPSISRGDDKHTLRITDNPDTISALWSQVKSKGVQAGEFLLGKMSGSGGRPILRPITTLAVLTLNEKVHIDAGSGDDITVHLTDGTSVTGAEYVQRVLSDVGYTVLVHPLHGPVNAYRTQRFASDKQRLMAWAESTTCAWRGCRKPAEESQIHHIVPWIRGGETNPSNLAVLCDYHNRVNQDDPDKPNGRGRIERPASGGEPRWVPSG